MRCEGSVLGLSVRLYVCFCTQQTGTGSVLHWLYFETGDFRKSAAFKSYGVKTKSRSQYANYHRPTSTGSARSVYLEGTRSHNEGRVSTRMLSTTVASPCQTLRELLAWRRRVMHTISDTAHAQFAECFCTLVLFINPRRACAARVTVLGLCVCLSVCLSVCQQLFWHYRL